MGNWTDRYSNIPFLLEGRTLDGADCWGLVMMVYQQELGISLPDCGGIATDHSALTLRAIARKADEERAKLIEIQEPEEFAIVLLRHGLFGCHVGVSIGNEKMIHLDYGTNSAIEQIFGITWKHRIVGFYRHAQRNR